MGAVIAVEDDAWQDIPLGLDPRVRDLLGNSVALNTTASVKQEQESGRKLFPTLLLCMLIFARPSVNSQLGDAQCQ